MLASQIGHFVGNLYRHALGHGDWDAVARIVRSRFRAEACILWVDETVAGRARSIEGMAVTSEYPMGLPARSALLDSGNAPYLITTGVLSLDHGSTGELVVWNTSRNDGFDEEQRRAMRAFAPHLASALRLARKATLETIACRMTDGALEQLGCGVLIVDGAWRVHWASALARRMIADGGQVTIADERIVVRHEAAAAKLDQAIQRATSPAKAETLMTIPTADHGRISVAVRPAELSAGAMPHPLVCVLIDSPIDRSAPDEGLIAQLYGLTPAEARLASAVLAGKRVQEHAAEQGVSNNTVRSQLKKVFRKTGEARQSELIRMALGNVLLRIHRERE